MKVIDLDSKREQEVSVKYKITAQHGKFKNSDILNSGKDFGGADKFLSVAFVKTTAGYSAIVFSINEDGQPFSGHEQLMAWEVLTAQLAKDQALPSYMRNILIKAFNEFSDRNQFAKAEESEKKNLEKFSETVKTALVETEETKEN